MNCAVRFVFVTIAVGIAAGCGAPAVVVDARLDESDAGIAGPDVSPDVMDAASLDDVALPDAASRDDAFDATLTDAPINEAAIVRDVATDTAPRVYQNVVLDESGDPQCVRFDGAYHVYLPDQLGGGNGGRVLSFTSTDMVHWRRDGEIFRNEGESYGGRTATGLWAPAVLPFGGMYYLYYVNVMSNPSTAVGDRDIVVTASADPTDFSHGTGRTVLLDDAGAFIDPSPYIDPVSGGLYLVYKQRPTSMTGSHVHIRPMRNPTTFSGPATLLISSADVPMSEAIVEQPMMFHAGGVYFLLFSTGNGATTTYRIDYATSANLTGPFNYRGTIFRTNADTSVPLSRRVIAPGSSSIVRDGAGDPWMVYRQKTTLEDTFANRGVCIDPIEIDPAARAIRGMPTKGVTRPAPAPL